MNDNNESQTKVVSILLIYCLSCLNEQSKNDLTDGHTNERQGSNWPDLSILTCLTMSLIQIRID